MSFSQNRYWRWDKQTAADINKHKQTGRHKQTQTADIKKHKHLGRHPEII